VLGGDSRKTGKRRDINKLRKVIKTRGGGGLGRLEELKEENARGDLEVGGFRMNDEGTKPGSRGGEDLLVV